MEISERCFDPGVSQDLHDVRRANAAAPCLVGIPPAQAADWWGNRPVGPFILSDDGVKENWPSVDGGRLDAKKWKAMATWALGFKNLGGLEHLAEGSTLEYQAGVFMAIGAAYCAKFGAWPVNTGKRHYEASPPEYVEVTICRASGLIANPCCPDPFFILPYAFPVQQSFPRCYRCVQVRSVSWAQALP